MPVTQEERRFEFVMIEDSDDTRLFIELSSYAADLVEARDALELALQANADPESPLRDAERALINSAAMAYCRAVMVSAVRPPITEHVEIPAEYASTHELVRMFRNRTVAHSQSDLSVTYAVGVLDADTLDVLDVSAPNISSTMPPDHVRRFLALVNLVEERLDEVIHPVRERLAQRLADTDRAALVQDGTKPTVRELRSDDFSSGTTRSHYPTTHPAYWTSRPLD